MNLETEVAATSAIDAVVSGSLGWCVLRGDNTEILPLIPDEGVTHVITDPPYSDHVHGKQRRMLRGSGGRSAKDGAKRGEIGFAPLGFEALGSFQREACAIQFARVTQRWCLVFSDVETCGDWRVDLGHFGLKHIRQGVWVKIGAQPQLSGDRPGTGFESIEIAHNEKARCRWNGGGMPAVWSYQIAVDRNNTGDRVHTTQKPVDLMLRLVEQFTDPGDIVLDPFCGSGTTGVACIRLGRRFIGIEKDAKYAAVAQERLLAESQGLNLRDARAGQLPMFGGGK